MSLSADDMILYKESPMESTKKRTKLLETIKYKVNLQDTKLMQKNPLHFYILTKIFRKRKEKPESFCNCKKKNKISRNKLNQGCDKPVYRTL